MNAYAEKKTTLRQKRERVHNIIVSKTFRISLIVLIVAFGFMYVCQTNSVSAKGYQISDLEKKVQKLQLETRKLDAEIAQHKSMQSIQERLKQTDLVAITSVDYMTVQGNAVALR